MKWQLLPSRNTVCFFVVAVLWQKRLSVNHFLWCRIQKNCCRVIYILAFAQSTLVILLRWRAVIERSKPFTMACLQQYPKSTMKGEQQREENSIFALLPAPRSQWHWELELDVKCVAAISKMRATCQSFSQENSYITEVATENKDVNTSKGEFKNYSHLML